ncbi:MAG: hypothetical protein PHS64_08295, partial [Candidatus Omnitrophica bacterium]|nr:hypothetical protein [Candidatus Omnitrophota bacterium]
LEYALGFYGLIPEQAAAVTSTTTLKTARFENISGAFIYQHIKPEAFRGFRSARDSAGLAYFIAEPEKAVVDFLYLRSRSIPDASTAVFAESFRFQNTGVLSARKILEFSRLFDSRRLAELANGFCGFLKEARHR